MPLDVCGLSTRARDEYTVYLYLQSTAADTQNSRVTDTVMNIFW